MTRDEELLNAAICANPDDDDRRLVYADWLEENGRGDHAELIRVMIAAEQTPDEDARRRPLVLRARELLYAHENRLRDRLPKKARQFSCHYRRGFVNRVYGTTARFVKDGAALARSVPLEEATLTKVKGRVPDLAAAPALANLRGLGFDMPGESDVIDVLDSPHLDRLTRLDLKTAPLFYEAVSAQLAEKPRLAQLTTLRPGRMDAGLPVLLRSPHLKNLTFLDLQNNDFSLPDLRALVKCKRLGQLTGLSLHYAWPRDPRAVDVLPGWEGVERLTWLDLSLCFFGDEELRRLARGCRVPRLRSLNLSNNHLTSACVEALLSWPGLDGLTELDVGSNEIEPAALAELLRSPRLARLCRLGASGGLDDPDRQERARVVAEAPGLQLVHTLDVDFGLDDEGPELRCLHDRFTPWAFFGGLWPMRTAEEVGR